MHLRFPAWLMMIDETRMTFSLNTGPLSCQRTHIIMQSVIEFRTEACLVASNNFNRQPKWPTV